MCSLLAIPYWPLALSYWLFPVGYSRLGNRATLKGFLLKLASMTSHLRLSHLIPGGRPFPVRDSSYFTGVDWQCKSNPR